MNTESQLANWRLGTVQAERMAADILQVEGFTEVDPQCPLGGPDGRKDILCSKNDYEYLCGCYFPTKVKKFKEIKDKFIHDLEGVEKNNVEGIVFFVNQHVSPTERKELLLLTKGICEVFHLERIRSILDSPKGYGIRLEYLRIAMNESEQISFWSAFNSKINDRFLTYELGVKDLSDKIDLFMMRTNALITEIASTPSQVSSSIPLPTFPTQFISIPLILWLHRLIGEFEEYKCIKTSGELRGVQVWIGFADSTIETAQYIPPKPAEVPVLLETLFSEWRLKYNLLSAVNEESRLIEIVKFHHELLSIHPFLDANGRVARCVLEQQVLELTGKRVSSDFLSEKTKYYDCLRLADSDDINPLIDYIRSSLE